MYQSINDSHSLIIEYNGTEYILIHLNADIIEEFKNDTNQLSQHFHRCLISGSNICIREKDVSLPPIAQAAQQLVSKKTPTVKQTAEASVAKRLAVLSDENSVPSTSKKAKKIVKLTDEEQNGLDEMLATEVMMQPMLHNPKLKSNKFAGMKAEKWNQICEKIHEDFPNADTTMGKIKERWIHIRDDYLKRLRMNKKSSGSGFSEIEQGHLDELLSGLNDVYELKETASNITQAEKSSEVQTLKGATSNRKIQDNKIEDGALQIIEKSSEKFLSAIDNIKDSFVNKKENAKNHDKVAAFCDCILLELRELDDKTFRKAQIQILQIISSLKDQ